MLKLCQLHPCPNGTLGLHLSRAPWDPYPWVSGVQEGSGAQRAGVRTGDTVLEMNGRDVLGLRISQIAADIGDHWRSGAACVTVVIWRNRSDDVGSGGGGGRRKQQVKREAKSSEGRGADGGEEQEDPEEEAVDEEEDVEDGGAQHSGGVINQQSLQKFATCLQHIAQLLECPVCLEVVRPPGWQCCNGHVLCNNCRGRSVKCPVCRVALGPRGRCLLSDKLFTLLAESFPCDGVRNNSNNNTNNNNSNTANKNQNLNKNNTIVQRNNNNTKMTLVKKRKSDSNHSSSTSSSASSSPTDLRKCTEDFHNRPKMATMKPKETSAVEIITTRRTSTTMATKITPTTPTVTTTEERSSTTVAETLTTTTQTTTTQTTPTLTTATTLHHLKKFKSPKEPQRQNLRSPRPQDEDPEAPGTTSTPPSHTSRLHTARICLGRPGEVHQSDELEILKTQTDKFSSSDSVSPAPARDAGSAVVVVRVASLSNAATTTTTTRATATTTTRVTATSTKATAATGTSLNLSIGRKWNKDRESFAVDSGATRGGDLEAKRKSERRDQGIDIGLGMEMRVGGGVGNNVVVRVELKSNEKTRDALMDKGFRNSCNNDRDNANKSSSGRNNNNKNNMLKIHYKEAEMKEKSRTRTRPDPRASAVDDDTTKTMADNYEGETREKSHEIRVEDKVARVNGTTRWIHEEGQQQKHYQQIVVQQYQNYYCPTGKSCCCYVQSSTQTRTRIRSRPGLKAKEDDGEVEREIWMKPTVGEASAVSAAMNKCLSTSSVTGGSRSLSNNNDNNNNSNTNDEDVEIAQVTSLDTTMTATKTKTMTTKSTAATSGSYGIWSAEETLVHQCNQRTMGPTATGRLEASKVGLEDDRTCCGCVLRALRTEWQVLAHLTQVHGTAVAHYQGVFGARVRVRFMHSKSPVPCISLVRAEGGAGHEEPDKFFVARIPIGTTTTTTTMMTTTTSAAVTTAASLSLSSSTAPIDATSISCTSQGMPRIDPILSTTHATKYAVFLWHLNALPPSSSSSSPSSSSSSPSTSFSSPSWSSAPPRYKTIIESGRTGVRWFGLAHPLSKSWARIRAEGHFLLHPAAQVAVPGQAREIIDVAGIEHKNAPPSPEVVDGTVADDDDDGEEDEGDFFDIVIRIK